MKEITLANSILGFIWTEYAWEMYLNWRQYRIAKRTKTMPIELAQDTRRDEFELARKYHMDKLILASVKTTYVAILASVTIVYAILAKVWDAALTITGSESEIFVSCVWLSLLNAIQTCADLPLRFYFVFILEEKYGFNKQNIGIFLSDTMKAVFVEHVLGLPLATIIILIIRNGGEYFFVWLWLTIALLLFLLVYTEPIYISPIFNTFTQLPVGPLRTEIEALANEVNFPISELYIINGSQRTSHSNAYFTGICGHKRIVLYDTLLTYESSHVLAILAHEFGHWKFHHLTKNLLISQIDIILTCFLFAQTFKNPNVYTAFGFRDNVQPALVGFMLVMHYILAPYHCVSNLFKNMILRKFEFEADAFAVHLNRGAALQRSLIILYKDNLSYPVIDWLYSAWHFSHPPILERIRAIKNTY